MDDALPKTLFGALDRAVKRLGVERLRVTYQTTFWCPFDRTSRDSLPELCVDALRNKFQIPSDVIGVEWWLSRMYTTNVRVDFHTDRDEALALERGKEVAPRMSSVLFLNTCRGGLLAVTSQPPNDSNPSRAPDIHDFELVRPKPNRFTFFEGSLTHGVLDANNQIPERPLSGPPGRLRRALILNWWHQKPLDVPLWAQTRHYRALAPRPATANRRPVTDRDSPPR